MAGPTRVNTFNARLPRYRLGEGAVSEYYPRVSTAQNSLTRAWTSSGGGTSQKMNPTRATRDVAGLAWVNTSGGVHLVYDSVEGHSWTPSLLRLRSAPRLRLGGGALVDVIALGNKTRNQENGHQGGGTVTSSVLHFTFSKLQAISTSGLEEGRNERMAGSP